MAAFDSCHEGTSLARVVARPALCLGLTLAVLGCGRGDRQAVEPIAVSQDGEQRDGPTDDAPTTPPADGTNDTEPSTDATPPGGGALAKGAGLWVVDAQGAAVGWLVQRGHPFQTQDGQVDILRDGVLVYSVSAGVFFGVEMHSGNVLVPRLGIADSTCNTPAVAGYYAKGEQISGMAYAFPYRGTWWRIKAGAPTAVVQCAGVTKQGATPTCVLHSGTCRGFPVEVLPSAKLPMSFQAPLRFSFGVTP